jgi:hypothetical protein
MQQFNLYVENFSDISDDALFLEVGKSVKEFPFCGENMVMQLLTQWGFRDIGNLESITYKIA